jgi:hypothetical protein
MKVKSLRCVLSLLLSSFLLMTGCTSRNADIQLASVSGAEFSGPDTIVVLYNQTIQIGETTRSLRFDTLFRDSRCPEDVNCIWQGAWEIGMKLMDKDITYSLKLGTYLQRTLDTTVAGTTIHVLDLLPRPNTSVKHAKSDYRAVVVIKKAPPDPASPADSLP